MQFSWSHLHFHKAYMSLLNRMSYVPWASVWTMCPCAKVPNACELLIFMCQRANKRANVLKVYPLLNLGCQHARGETNFSTWQPKDVQIFQLFFKEFFNFWIFQSCSTFANFKNIRVILENLSRKAKNFNFDICKISLKKNLVSLTPLTSFSMENVGLTEQLFS